MTPASGDGVSLENVETLFTSQLDLVERVVAFVSRRHHISAQDRDDFLSHVRLKLIEDDYAILRKFEGRSSLRTFLTVVIHRLFLDYRTSAWGKWRPSAEARRTGAVGVLLEQLVVRDGYTFEEAVELMTVNHRVTATRAELEALAGRLPNRNRRRFESEEILIDVPSAGEAPDEAASAHDRRAVAARVQEALNAAMAQCGGQDRLILALRFEDGRTIPEIAAILRVDQKALYRRLARLLHDLRRTLQHRGIDGEAVADMLSSSIGGFSSDVEVESQAARPSMSKGAQEWR